MISLAQASHSAGLSSGTSVKLIECPKWVLVQREHVWKSCPCSSNDGGWQLYRVIWKCHHKCKAFHQEIYVSGVFDARNVKASLREPCFMWFLERVTEKVGDISEVWWGDRQVWLCFWNGYSWEDVKVSSLCLLKKVPSCKLFIRKTKAKEINDNRFITKNFLHLNFFIHNFFVTSDN